MKKMRKKLLTWSISSGLLISTALYSSLSLAYRIDRSSDSIQSISKIPIKNGELSEIKLSDINKKIESIEIYKGKYNLIKNKNLSSELNDQSAINITDGSEVIFNKIKIQKKGKTTSIYSSGITGLNAAVLNDGNVILDNSNIRTFGKGAKAYYQSGINSKGTIVASIIETTQNDSNGIEVANEGVLKLNNVAINTQGDRSAGISSSAKSKLENNKVIVFTTGKSSPGFYNGGRLSLIDSDINANNSYIGINEGENNLISINSKLKGMKGIKIINHSDNDDINDEGMAVIGFKNGFIDVKEDPVFIVENMSAIINLNNTEIKNKNKIILSVNSNKQRTITLNLFEQKLFGDINNNENSNINVRLSNNSIYNGSILNGASLNIDESSKWFVKDDSIINRLILPNNNPKYINKYIVSNGKNILYNSKENKWLKDRVIKFSDGGSMIPV